MAKKSRHLATRAVSWAWLTRCAFVLALALVIARMLMLETLRDPTDAAPGVEAGPLGPGAAAGLVLDLLCVLPALLVLVRRVVDRQYALRWSWAAGFMLLLGLWSVCSTLWAPDRFLALVSSLHWLSAMVLLWAAMQLIDSPLRLRMVGGVCLGLLLALVVSGYYFRLVDWPDLKTAWETNRADILREHGWSTDSFDARQFEKRIYNGEPMGFSASPNTYGALLVLLGTVAAGLALQRWADGDGIGWIIVPGIVIAASITDLVWAESRGAAATAVMAAALLCATRLFRDTLRQRAAAIYWYTLAVCLLIAAGVIGHGMCHHSLVHPSLTFRWRYWVGSARMIAAHPLLGVGWENFGLRYLAYRLPIASEEIRDPHNFIVRIVAELGAIGGILLIAGMLRLAWELTQISAAQTQAPEAEYSARTQRQGATQRILAVATLAVLINFFAAVDLNTQASYVLLEAMRRGLDWLLLIVGLAAATLKFPAATERQLRNDELEFVSDPRPAPWLIYAMIIGLGMFLVHNLIDFALFEFGPMFLFALLAGAALGARNGGRRGATAPKIWAAAALGLGATAWIVVASAVAFPIIEGESFAHDADNAIRGRRSDLAAADLQAAIDQVPYNADYALRLARLTGRRDALDHAIAVNPASVDALVMRAELEARETPANVAGVRADFARALTLDPNNVSLHLRFAELLRRFGDAVGAKREYQLAVEKNADLDRDDPKRVTDLKQ